MTLESLVTSLDLSRQLKAADAPQKSALFWVKANGDDHFQLWRYSSARNRSYISEDKIAAYTAEEMMRLLPQGLASELDPNIPFRWSVWRDGVGYAIGYEYDGAEYVSDDSLANAGAKLYLSLKEKGLV